MVDYFYIIWEPVLQRAAVFMFKFQFMCRSWTAVCPHEASVSQRKVSPAYIFVMDVFQERQLWLEEIHRPHRDVFTHRDVDRLQTLAVLHQEEQRPAGFTDIFTQFSCFFTLISSPYVSVILTIYRIAFGSVKNSVLCILIVKLITFTKYFQGKTLISVISKNFILCNLLPFIF